MALLAKADSNICFQKFGVDDGARTHDRRNHNPELYQLSYAHHCSGCVFYPDLKPFAPPYMARPAGLEPATPGLEGRCSIRLSYGRYADWSGWRDSNSRPTAPKAVALPGCATPRHGVQPGIIVEFGGVRQCLFYLFHG